MSPGHLHIPVFPMNIRQETLGCGGGPDDIDTYLFMLILSSPSPKSSCPRPNPKPVLNPSPIGTGVTMEHK